MNNTYITLPKKNNNYHLLLTMMSYHISGRINKNGKKTKKLKIK